jgi:putative (di)nucleoside polyphosphate hydrolase
MALTELSRYLPRNDNRNRYLRHGGRARGQEHTDQAFHAPMMFLGAGMELPPGAMFDPDPQQGPAAVDYPVK